MPEQRILLQMALDGFERDDRKWRNDLYDNAFHPLLDRDETVPFSKGLSKGGSRGCRESDRGVSGAALLDGCLMRQACPRPDPCPTISRGTAR